MQPQTVKSMMFTSARQPGTSGRDPKPEEVGGFACLPLDQMLERQLGPRRRSRPQCASMTRQA